MYFPQAVRNESHILSVLRRTEPCTDEECFCGVFVYDVVCSCGKLLCVWHSTAFSTLTKGEIVNIHKVHVKHVNSVKRKRCKKPVLVLASGERITSGIKQNKKRGKKNVNIKRSHR